MKKYVMVVDTLVSFTKQIEIEANDEDEARQKLLALAVEALNLDDYDSFAVVNHDFDVVNEK